MDNQSIINLLLGVLVMLIGFIGLRLHNRQDKFDESLQKKVEKEEFNRQFDKLEKTFDRAVDRLVKVIRHDQSED